MICNICKLKPATKGCYTCSLKCSCDAVQLEVMPEGSTAKVMDEWNTVKSRYDEAVHDRLLTRYK